MMTQDEADFVSSVTKEILPKVIKGIDLLNELEHGWHEHIDLSELDMSWGPNCVLGQLFNNNYSAGMKSLYQRKFPDLPFPHDLDRFFEDYGFSIDCCCPHFVDDNHPCGWSVLTTLWKEEIGKLRDAQQDTESQSTEAKSV